MPSELRNVVRPLAASRPLRTLLVALFLTYAYFVPAPAWNENSRFALTRALVEHQTTAIDAYHYTTGDKSFRAGHFYCDKAPGASLLATVPYSLFYGLRRLVGAEPPGVQVIPLDPLDIAAKRAPAPDDLAPGDRLRFDSVYRVGLYLCNLGTTVIATLAAVAALYLAAWRVTDGRRQTALLVAATYALATPAFVYTTALYGHQLAASFLFVGFALVALLTARRRVPHEQSPATSRRDMAPWLVGTLLGWAVLCEYPSVIPVLMLVIYAFARHGVGFVVRVALAGAVWAGVLAGYHFVSFGSPFRTGYDFVYLPEFAEGMKVNYGVGMPDPEVLLAILFGDFRGLFYLSPVLLLATWGLWPGYKRARSTPSSTGLDRGAYLTAAGIIAFYLLLNASYYMWDGGSAFGPRHLIPILPFVALGAVDAIDRYRGAFLILAAYSLASCLVGAHAGPLMPQWGDPLWEHAWPKLFQPNLVWFDGPTNAGRLLGLPGGASLLPLLALWWWLRPWAVEPSEGSEAPAKTRREQTR